MSSAPGFEPPHHAAIRPTTFLEPEWLASRLGLPITLATETFQQTGSFKFRAAYHVAATVAPCRFITASSGNFGQALACACRKLGKTCTVVMPQTSVQAKIEAVRAYGGMVDLLDVRSKTRDRRVAELAEQDPDAYVASPFDDPLVIAGNATLGVELARAGRTFDCILAPVGGGGLTAGLITGLTHAGANIPVVGVEPLLANDAARSLRTGQLVANDVEPLTLADGVRTLSVGRHNWPILRQGLREIVEVTEDHIRQAVRLLFLDATLKAEPTGALSVAALLAQPDKFRGRRVCCVISGGNVDARTYAEIIAG
ncbi:MAG TPA: pyridoxal-phosphate dependent enzyme [Verrucomicrobiae bacterium]|nr:pyridoxal-phosphate dependent enzyme [Verrucomicrobiae bacterium]